MLNPARDYKEFPYRAITQRSAPLEKCQEAPEAAGPCAA
jgi:hypothetical protein